MAEPITGDLAKAFPHLAPHQGQLLLASGPRQWVVGAIPPDTAEAWLDGVVAVYRWDPSQGWRKVDVFQQLSVKLFLSDGRFLFPVGLDTDTNGDEAGIELVMRTQGSRSVEIRLRYHLGSLGGHLSVVQPQVPSTSPLSIAMRVVRGIGQIQPVSQPLDQGSSWEAAGLIAYRGSLGAHFTWNEAANLKALPTGLEFVQEVTGNHQPLLSLTTSLGWPSGTCPSSQKQACEAINSLARVPLQVELPKPETDSAPGSGSQAFRLGLLRKDDPYLYTLGEDRTLLSGGVRPGSLTELIIPETDQKVFEVSIPRGSYQVWLVRDGESSSTYCQGEATLSPSQPVRLSCQHLEGGTKSGKRPKGFQGLFARQAAPLKRIRTEKIAEDLTVLEGFDPHDQLGFRLYPLTAAQRRAWRELGTKQETKQLKKLLTFRRDYAPQAKLELLCFANAGKRRYEDIVRRLDPDLIQILGCGNSVHQSQQLRVVDRLQQQRKTPYGITPAAWNQMNNWVSYAYPPKLYPIDATASPEGAALTDGRDLRTLQYSTGMGVQLAFRIQRLSRPGDVQGRFNLRLKYEKQELVHVERFVIRQGDRVLGEVKANEPGQWQSLNISGRRGSFVRIELLGRQTGLIDPVVVATSNFLQL